MNLKRIDFSGQITVLLGRISYMRRPLLLAIFIVFIASCEREIEEPRTDFGFEFMPLQIGLFWEYEVTQTIYFGENDFETSIFFYRDEVRTFFTNEEGETVYVVDRLKSFDRISWERESNYSRQFRELSLLENQENQTIVSMVFPPDPGVVWDANIYRLQDQDDFEVVESLSFEQGNRSEPGLLRILQNEADDKVTFRDNRYEIYQQNVGLVEKFYEVVTYCSRNDCLGDELINSGEITFMSLIDYGGN